MSNVISLLSYTDLLCDAMSNCKNNPNIYLDWVTLDAKVHFIASAIGLLLYCSLCMWMGSMRVV